MNTKTILTLYQKRSICFDIEICKCSIQKNIEPGCINVYFQNSLVRESLRKKKFKLLFPENWSPLTENHYMGIFTFTRVKHRRKFRLKRYRNSRLRKLSNDVVSHDLSDVVSHDLSDDSLKLLSHDIYKIEEGSELRI